MTSNSNKPGGFRRLLKVIAIVYLIGLHAFIFQHYLRSCTLPSFHYNFYYKNETSHEFLLLKVMQLTDVAFGPAVLPNAFTIVSKDEIGHIQIPGEIDSLNTLFIVTAIPCTEKGGLIEVKTTRAFMDIVPFSSIRDNTFSSGENSLRKQKIYTITDTHFMPIEDLLKRFEMPLENDQ